MGIVSWLLSIKGWVLTTVFGSIGIISYLAYSYNLSPGEWSDVVSAMTAVVSLPAILMTVVMSKEQEVKSKKQEAEYREQQIKDRNKLNLTTYLELMDRVNDAYDRHAYNIIYNLKTKGGLTPYVSLESWRKNNEGDNLMGYIKQAFFDSTSNDTVKHIRKSNNTHVLQMFVKEVDLLETLIEGYSQSHEGESLHDFMKQHELFIVRDKVSRAISR